MGDYFQLVFVLQCSILKTALTNRKFSLCFQVTQRQTGEVMVLKELLHYDEEANTSFLKEVS